MFDWIYRNRFLILGSVLILVLPAIVNIHTIQTRLVQWASLLTQIGDWIGDNPVGEVITLAIIIALLSEGAGRWPVRQIVGIVLLTLVVLYKISGMNSFAIMIAVPTVLWCWYISGYDWRVICQLLLGAIALWDIMVWYGPTSFAIPEWIEDGVKNFDPKLNYFFMFFDWLVASPKAKILLIIVVLVAGAAFPDTKTKKWQEAGALLLFTLIILWELPLNDTPWLACFMVALAIVLYKGSGKGFHDTVGLLVVIIILWSFWGAWTVHDPLIGKKVERWFTPSLRQSTPVAVRKITTPSPTINNPQLCKMRIKITKGKDKGQDYTVSNAFRKEGNKITIWFNKGGYGEYNTVSFDEKNGYYGTWFYKKNKDTDVIEGEGEWTLKKSKKTPNTYKGRIFDEASEMEGEIDVTIIQ